MLLEIYTLNPVLCVTLATACEPRETTKRPLSTIRWYEGGMSNRVGRGCVANTVG